MDASIIRTAEGTYTISATIRHADSGWDHYADAFDVRAPDGTILGTRTLTHPHEQEQPFTRTLTGIVIPRTVSSVTVRAHDKVHEYGGVELILTIPQQ